MNIPAPKKIPPPRVASPRIDTLTLPDWDQAASTFAASPVMTLRQSWRAEPDPAYRPTEVRTGWTERAVFVYARMEDADIFNPVTEFNAPSFQHGDVFEMFLRPMPGETYYEFHVTPENQKFQLRIPSAAAFAAGRGKGGLPPDYFIGDRVLDTQVHVIPDRQCWEVLAEIPFSFVGANGASPVPNPWLVSFSRYDYTRGAAAPVLSSTSAHQEADFHRQQDWTELVFENGQPNQATA